MLASLDVTPIDPRSGALAAALAQARLPSDDLRDGGGRFVQLSTAGRVVGFGGFELYGSDALVRSIVVLPQARRRGHGKALVGAVLDRARAAGARRAFLLTTDASDFFRRLGFSLIDRAAAPPQIVGSRQATTVCTSAALLSLDLDQGG